VKFVDEIAPIMNSDSVWFVVVGILAVVCILALIGSLVSFFT
jgi:hypothetical protein